MPDDPNSENLNVGIIGAGAMGRGIAQVAAVGGCIVKLYDKNPKVSIDAVEFVDKMLSRAIEKNKITALDAENAVKRIKIVNKISEFKDVDVIIEAATEDLNIKREIFQEVESVVSKETIIASNTSSLSITTIASKFEYPDRLAGFHFFNPVPLMKLVEVINGVRTKPGVLDFLVGLGKRLGREPVLVSDAPGFLVNQVGRGYTVEAAHACNEGVASFSRIDEIMRDAACFKMGPFELMDLTGIDVTHPATKLIYEQFYHEPRFRPSTLMQSRMEGGFLGRKSGEGFYRYEDGKQVANVQIKTSPYDGRAVWVSRSNLESYPEIIKLITSLGGNLDNGTHPGKESIIIIAPLGVDATTAALKEQLEPRQVIAIDTLFSLTKRRTLMRTPITKSEISSSAYGLFGADSVPVSIIQDSPGFITQRIIAMIVNIGCSIAQFGGATPKDIDKAVVLGLGYPLGPLAFGDSLGVMRVFKILDSIFKITGDPRYRPTLWLRRRAALGISLLTLDNQV